MSAVHPCLFATSTLAPLLKSSSTTRPRPCPHATISAVSPTPSPHSMCQPSGPAVAPPLRPDPGLRPPAASCTWTPPSRHPRLRHCLATPRPLRDRHWRKPSRLRPKRKPHAMRRPASLAHSLLQRRRTHHHPPGPSPSATATRSRAASYAVAVPHWPLSSLRPCSPPMRTLPCSKRATSLGIDAGSLVACSCDVA